MSAPERVYNFPLPYAVTGAELSMGGIRNYPVYHKLPPDLKYALDNLGFFETHYITKEELDALPEDVWQEIKTLIAPQG